VKNHENNNEGPSGIFSTSQAAEPLYFDSTPTLYDI